MEVLPILTNFNAVFTTRFNKDQLSQTNPHDALHNSSHATVVLTNRFKVRSFLTIIFAVLLI